MRKIFSLLLVFVLTALLLVSTGCDTDKEAAKTYTVVFNSNGGTGNAPTAQSVSEGSSLKLPAGTGLSKAGYSFGGWNTRSNGTGTNYEAGSSYTPVSDLTLYAKWERGYIVTFHANGASRGEVAPITAMPGAAIRLPDGGVFFRSGYLFGGWNTKSDGTGTGYAAGDSFTPDSHVTLYVKWDAGYTIEYHLNGGSGVIPEKVTVRPGTGVKLPSVDGISRDGYTSNSWNTKFDGTGTTYEANSSFTPNGSVVMYVKWDAVFVIRYNLNRGQGDLPPQVQVPRGESITLPDAGNRTIVYADFNGWNTKADGTGNSYAASSSFTPQGDVTFYVNWNITTQLANLTTLAAKLAWTEAHNRGEAVTIYVNADETIQPTTINWGKITLIGQSSNRTISLGSNGSMFQITDGVTLTLGNNITLKGRDRNTMSLVKVYHGAELIMETGSAITDNYAFGGGHWDPEPLKGFGGDGYGGAVYLVYNVYPKLPKFTMNGGTIRGNSANRGGGAVYVGLETIFEMNGGVIAGNTVYYNPRGGVRGASGGGGVYIEWSYLNLNDGNAKFYKRATGEATSAGGVAAGGIIYGYNTNASYPNNNKVIDSNGNIIVYHGHAAFIDWSISENPENYKFRDKDTSQTHSMMYTANHTFSGWETDL